MRKDDKGSTCGTYEKCIHNFDWKGGEEEIT